MRTRSKGNCIRTHAMLIGTFPYVRYEEAEVNGRGFNLEHVSAFSLTSGQGEGSTFINYVLRELESRINFFVLVLNMFYKRKHV